LAQLEADLTARPDVDPLAAEQFCEKFRKQFTRMAEEYRRVTTNRKSYGSKRACKGLSLWFGEPMVRELFERDRPKSKAELEAYVSRMRKQAGLCEV
jgi:hypothetical protein